MLIITINALNVTLLKNSVRSIKLSTKSKFVKAGKKIAIKATDGRGKKATIKIKIK